MIIKTIDDWKVLAKTIAPELKPGMILALSGPLGAGKTTFVQALAHELGAKDNPRSPTFSLVRTYKVGARYIVPLRRLVHVDAYRIEKSEDMLPLNLDEELATPGSIIALEWPENVEAWLKKQPSVLELKIEVKQNQEREVSWLSGV